MVAGRKTSNRNLKVRAKIVCARGARRNWTHTIHGTQTTSQREGGAGKVGKGKENIALTDPSHGAGKKKEAKAERKPVPRSEVVLPLEPWTLVHAMWRGEKMHPSRIVDVRVAKGTDELKHEYYVHYRGLNRRMDTWVDLEDLDLDTVIPPEPLDPNDPKAKKRRYEDHSEEEGEGHEAFNKDDLIDHEEVTKVKNVGKIELGRYSMETWYFSPLPEEYSGVKTLYWSEFDLKFFLRREELVRHLKKVKQLHPPGVEIYRHKGISVFEVDGRKDKEYCRNLCYLAKLFLDHKSLVYDVDFFLFYVMCECDERGAHITGYFSKEKFSEEGCNLACILTLPAYQKRGYGKFLISFSYELSKIEGKIGTPERPLSDLGLVSYRGYWTRTLLSILKEREDSISIKELSDLTMIKPDDIISTLQHLEMIQYIKGQHVICAAPHAIEAHLKACGSPGLPVEPKKIIWQVRPVDLLTW